MNDLRAAAKRLQRVHNGEEVRVVYGGMEKAPSLQHMMDRLTTSDAYLAEHPADEDEPHDMEWWRDISSDDSNVIPHGGYCRGSMASLYLVDGLVSLAVEDESSAVSIPLPHIKTRGDVRQALKALVMGE